MIMDNRLIHYCVCAVLSLMACACSRDQEPEVLGALFLGDGEVRVLDYVAVDLGLSVQWASTNVGVLRPSDGSMFFAWGETSEKSSYSWDTYTFFSSRNPSLLKYNMEDGLLYLQPADDPARAVMGAGWRVPTGDELVELLENCSWTISNGRGGKIITATSEINGNSIEFPLAGYKSEESLNDVGDHGYIWSSERVEDTPSSAYIIDFNAKANKVSISTGDRAFGLCVRGVRSTD